MWAMMVCADWSKDPKRREVYAAWPAERRVGRLVAPEGGWTVPHVLAAADSPERGGSVLVGFDAPIGVPESYWRAVHAGAVNVPAWLRTLPRNVTFFEPLSDPTRWSVKRAFVRIPPRKGSRRAFEQHLADKGIDLLRKIDRLAHAKPVFIAGGIPGSVGSAAIDLWRGLGAALLDDSIAPAVWPFDGGLERLASSRRVVVSEMYPRLAYALAAAPNLSAALPPLAVAKTCSAVRTAFIDRLLERGAWPWRLGVRLDDVALAHDSEDAFDALVTAAALLRCELEGPPLSDPVLEDNVAEGGILGSGGVRLDQREMVFKGGRTVGSRCSRAPRQQSVPCPIPGCAHEFRGSRGGWDGHVGSRRLYPTWHPEIRKPEERKERFQVEFAEFLRGANAPNS